MERKYIDRKYEHEVTTDGRSLPGVQLNMLFPFQSIDTIGEFVAECDSHRFQ